MADLLQIKDLKVSVEGKQILKGINLTINKGEIHVVMGTNGAGKSTLANAIMGNTTYTVDSGSIVFDGKDITEDAVMIVRKQVSLCPSKIQFLFLALQ